MPRHANYLPNGVIPAILLPFNDDLSIDERAFRAHIRDVAMTEGLSALTINAHSTEGRLLHGRRAAPRARHHAGRDRRQAAAGARRLGDGSLEAARIAMMATAGGASALAGVSAGAVTMGQNATWRSRISNASRTRPTCR